MSDVPNSVERIDQMGKPITREVGRLDISIPVAVVERDLVMTMGIATGHIEHEGEAYEVEVSAAMPGGVVVEVKIEGTDYWRTYHLTAEALIRRVFETYLTDPAKPEQFTRKAKPRGAAKRRRR
jgi:hypothetical protein